MEPPSARKDKGEIMSRVLLLGLDPETVDYSDPALPPGMTAEKVHAGIAVAMKQFANSSTSRYESENRRYQRTAQTMTSGSKCRHLNSAGRGLIMGYTAAYQTRSLSFCNTALSSPTTCRLFRKQDASARIGTLVGTVPAQ